jgi:hypothetical protein
MGEALSWGLIAASSLLLGGLLALRRPIGLRSLGFIMALGAGVLISAVAYELVEDAFGTAGGTGAVALGLLAGPSPSTLGISPSTALEEKEGRVQPRLKTRAQL